jgi:hypothetical protein
MTEAEKAVVRKPGRPRKFGQGRINATVRFTPERYAKLKELADDSGRSVSEEVEARVERSFTDDRLEEIGRGVAKMEAEIANIAMEMLNNAQTRIAELEKAQALSEEMIERAVTRALAQARFTIGGSNTETDR